MKKKILAFISVAMLAAAVLAGCGNSESTETKTAETKEQVSEEPVVSAPIEDGEYETRFQTDSSMFHVNEACNGMGTLTVKNGQMTMHVSLVSKNIVNLYLGTAADAAQAEEADILQPTTDQVTYSDGYKEEVYGFDIPITVLDEEFDLAILGAKGTWYDHKVSVVSPE